MRQPSQRISYDITLLCLLAESPHTRQWTPPETARCKEDWSDQKVLAVSMQGHRAEANSPPAHFSVSRSLCTEWSDHFSASCATSIRARLECSSGVAALELAAGVASNRNKPPGQGDQHSHTTLRYHYKAFFRCCDRDDAACTKHWSGPRPAHALL